MSNRVRLNFSFPVEVVEELRELVPEGERSEVVVEGTRKELARRRLKKALDVGAGAWSEEEHPELRTPADTLRWLRELRASWEHRRD